MDIAKSSLELIRHIFDKKEWMCSYNPNARVLSATFIVSQVREKLLVILRDAEIDEPSYAGVINSCQLSKPIPKDRLNDVAEYLHRVNSLLVYGGFELDYEDRHCSYKLIIPRNFIQTATKDKIVDMILLPCRMFACFAPGLKQVTGGESPAKALKHVIVHMHRGVMEGARVTRSARKGRC